MRKATRIVAALFGAFAGFGGPEHGYFEILRGNARPDSLVIAAMGPPCDPEKVWNLCEPAMTVIPSYLVTGILALIIGLITMIWAAAFVHRKNGGLVLILLSIALLLVGGRYQDQRAADQAAIASLWQGIAFPGQVVAMAARRLLRMGFWTVHRRVFL
jgi:hypothetical protein